MSPCRNVYPLRYDILESGGCLIVVGNDGLLAQSAIGAIA
jgi:hypothetical protein